MATLKLTYEECSKKFQELPQFTSEHGHKYPVFAVHPNIFEQLFGNMMNHIPEGKGRRVCLADDGNSVFCIMFKYATNPYAFIQKRVYIINDRTKERLMFVC